MGIDSCRNLFKELKILPLMSQHIFSLLVFVVNNRDQFFINSEIRSINTGHGSNLHLPLANLHIYQKGVHYSGVKIFNSLPSSIKNFMIIQRNLKWFLKKFLYINSFYSLDEYYSNNSNK
jgi:hypothetical protein